MKNYSFYPFLLFRTPLLSTDQLFEAFSLQNQEFLEAIFLASSDFYDKLQMPNLSQKEKLKLEFTLYKYSARASHRCTPYGLFAGIGCATWGKTSEIILSKKYRRHSRLDMDILFSVFSYFSKTDEIIANLKYYANNSIYRIGNQLRYVEYEIKNGRRFYSIAAVDMNEFISEILKKSKGGAEYSELLTALINKKIPADTAIMFLNELIRSQILVSELEPTVSGEEYSIRLVKQLNTIMPRVKNEKLDFLLKNIELINNKLSSIDRHQEENNIQVYKEILTGLKNITGDLNRKTFLQVDMEHTTIKNEVSEIIKDKLLNTIKCLNILFPFSPNNNLEKFKERFLSRYEDRMMPILEIMDKDVGLGYPTGDTTGVNPLVDDLNFIDSKNESHFLSNNIQDFLFQKLIQAIQNKHNEVNISSTEIRFLNNGTSKFADTVSILFEVLDSNINQILFKYAGTPTASLLIGRFGFVSQEVTKMLKTISFDEIKNNPEKIVAEIVHLPQNRVGNVLFRPAFRDYEIPYLAQSSVRPKNQIDPQYIKIGIRNNRIVIWSEKHNKEVIPKLGNAHNHSTSEIPLYRFLCELQNQNNRNIIEFNWGSMENKLSFLPRVFIDDVIVYPSTWRFGKVELDKVRNEEEKALSNFINQYNLPNEILLCEGDNELYFNFQIESSRTAFSKELKKKSKLILKEYLHNKDSVLIKNNDKKNHTNECIAFLKKEKLLVEHIKTTPNNKVPCARKLILGSEWIYFKIYTGIKMADKLLVDTFFPLMLEMESKNLIDKWFFVRYNDPEFHLRLRLRAKKKADVGTVLKLLYKIISKLIDSGAVSNYSLDSYNREVERYKLADIENVETFFWLDSVAILSFLNIVKTGEREVLRWQWAIINVNGILDDFKLNSEQKIQFLERVLTNFNEEF
ncbi:MAG TPA: lantibiotic dehydratase, partial [Bacteroidia bacterium]|nr:lantibiotic dehydratase [Bacteroidia bacterium]